MEYEEYPMKTILLAGLLFSIAPALFAQEFDFKSLDKVGAHATSSTNLNLDGDTLKLASGFLGSDGNDKDADAVKGLIANMKAIYIREWKFDKPGQYDDNDLEPLRTFLKPWKTFLDVREHGESTQIYLKPAADSKNGGFALISAEPTEVTVIFIDGTLGLGDLQKLSGVMGVPDIRRLADPKADNKTKTTK
jgi:hypothetical protein